MPKQSQSSKPQPDEPRNLLQEASDELTRHDRASGLTVTDTGPQTDTKQYNVSFAPRRKTKQEQPPSE